MDLEVLRSQLQLETSARKEHEVSKLAFVLMMLLVCSQSSSFAAAVLLLHHPPCLVVNRMCLAKFIAVLTLA
jgi:hypothetical protein